MDSILSTIKQMLGIEADYDAFDIDIVVGINSALMALTQMGVGVDGGLTIKDETPTWKEFLGDDTNLEAAKTYVYLKVRLMFDPPSSSHVIEAMNRQISEYEWRLNVNGERG